MSFRKYGGMNYAATHNIVKSNINTADSLYVTNNVGQTNSYINFNSDISGNVLIFGDLDLSGNLNVSGTGDFTGSVKANDIILTSDYRIKDNVIPLDVVFTVDKLNPVTYTNTTTQKQDIGLIAHELQEQYPFLVNGIKDGEEMQSVNYIGLIGILIKEIQCLKKDVSLMSQQIVQLQNK